MKPSVLQHQFSVVRSDEEGIHLSTKGICICTGWYGWDKASGIHFLCHFDSPLSTLSIKKVFGRLERMLEKHQVKMHRFNSVLVGGKRWWWSEWTRRRIKQSIRNQENLNIRVLDGPYDGGCASRDLVITNKFRREKNHVLSGRSCPSGGLWFFKSMEDVSPNA